MKTLLGCAAALLLAGCGLGTTSNEEDELASGEQGLTVTASWDATLGVPACAAVGSGCSVPSALLSGRAANEANRPNTLGGCADLPLGLYPADTSIERISLSTPDAKDFAPGKTVVMNVTFRETADRQSRVDLFVADDASAPVWSLIGTLTPTASGSQSKALSFVLGSGGAARRAVRAQIRRSASASTPCTSAIDDADDLVFTVAVPPAPTPLTNGGFEPALASWTTGGAVTSDSSFPHGGVASAAFRPNFPTSASLSQQFLVPTGSTTLTFWYRVESTNTTSLSANIRVNVTPSSGTGAISQAFASNLGAAPYWQAVTLDVAALAGRSVTLQFVATNQFVDGANTFRVDDVSVQ
jgi:hypothetical protein